MSSTTLRLTLREQSLMRYARAVTQAGFANDLPQDYLPQHLQWRVWSRRHPPAVPPSPNSVAGRVAQIRALLSATKSHRLYQARIERATGINFTWCWVHGRRLQAAGIHGGYAACGHYYLKLDHPS